MTSVETSAFLHGLKNKNRYFVAIGAREEKSQMLHLCKNPDTLFRSLSFKTFIKDCIYYTTCIIFCIFFFTDMPSITNIYPCHHCQRTVIFTDLLSKCFCAIYYLFTPWPNTHSHHEFPFQNNPILKSSKMMPRSFRNELLISPVTSLRAVQVSHMQQQQTCQRKGTCCSWTSALSGYCLNNSYRTRWNIRKPESGHV